MYIAGLAAAYLYAGINLGIRLTRWIKGIDLLSTGTGRAGTANVGRTLGKGWAFPVFLFNLSKSLVPLILKRRFVFSESPVSLSLKPRGTR